MRRSLAVLLFLTAACSFRSVPPRSIDLSPSPSPVASPSPNPSPLPSPSPSYQWRTVVTFGPLSLHVPPGWGIDAQGDTAYVGPLAGGPQDVTLRIVKNFTGSVDALKPAMCPQEGDPPKPVQSVQVLQSGTAPFGNVAAQFRQWRVTCLGSVTTHRAWWRAVERLAIYEQVRSADTDDVIRQATVGQ